MLYNSNFDDSAFATFQVQGREFNKTIDDPCAIQARNQDNSKKLKFITTNHIDLIEGKEKHNFFGIGVRDQLFVPGEKIDGYSALLNGETGNQLTNCNVRNGFGQLPISTLPSRYQLFHGDVQIEDGMRNFYESKKNSCNPRETMYHNRHFYIFDNKLGIEVPDASRSVEGNEFGKRGGASTRYMK